MGIDRTVLSQLVDAGLVVAGKGPHGYVIEAGVADAFRRDYVGSTELAPMLGKEAGAAAHAVLTRAGVVPLRATPGFNATVYPRSEAVAAIRAFLAKEKAARARTERLAGARTVGDFLRSAGVQEFLGVTDTMLAQLGRARHLAVPLRAQRDGHSLLYPAEAVRRFAESYVLASVSARCRRPGARPSTATRASASPLAERSSGLRTAQVLLVPLPSLRGEGRPGPALRRERSPCRRSECRRG